MNADVAQRLTDLNRQFYQSQAESFSATRGRLQPGVLRVLERIPAQADILDLGCGNGTLAAELVRRGRTGRYVGVDFSEELLEEARSNVLHPRSDVRCPTSEARKTGGLDVKFVQAALTGDEWPDQLPEPRYQAIFAFAVLHHIPSRALRLGLLRQARGLLVPGGRFIHSNWQFLNSERLRARVQPWAAAGLEADDVDQGDYLLDWRRDGGGVRYVHHFSEQELAALAAESGFEVVEAFYSDGETGDLGLYEVWETG